MELSPKLPLWSHLNRLKSSHVQRLKKRHSSLQAARLSAREKNPRPHPSFPSSLWLCAHRSLWRVQHSLAFRTGFHFTKTSRLDNSKSHVRRPPPSPISSLCNRWTVCSRLKPPSTWLFSSINATSKCKTNLHQTSTSLRRSFIVCKLIYHWPSSRKLHKRLNTQAKRNSSSSLAIQPRLCLILNKTCSCVLVFMTLM